MSNPSQIPALEASPALDDEEGSIVSSTTSLTESIFDYRKLHGRLYKSTSTTEYWAPVDQIQNEAFDILHHVHLMISNDQLFHTPLGNDFCGKVLDIGTGTGVWALDFADQFSSASIIGTDIVAIQPSWVPPNCKFIIDDCLSEWAWPTNHFDFIHVRELYGSIPDWAALYGKAYKHLSPGGRFENVELDVKMESDHIKLDDDHVFNRWAKLFYDGGDKMGRSFRIAGGHTMRDLMVGAGFADVQEKKTKLPMHGWPKDPKLKSAGFLG